VHAFSPERRISHLWIPRLECAQQMLVAIVKVAPQSRLRRVKRVRARIEPFHHRRLRRRRRRRQLPQQHVGQRRRRVHGVADAICGRCGVRGGRWLLERIRLASHKHLLEHKHPSVYSTRQFARRSARLMERCDGGEDQGADEALWGAKRELSRQFWKPSPVRAALLSARIRVSVWVVPRSKSGPPLACTVTPPFQPPDPHSKYARTRGG